MFIKQTRERKRKIESERERFKGNNSHSVLDSLFDDRLLYSFSKISPNVKNRLC